jgi:acyl-CoA thioester hydrolase
MRLLLAEDDAILSDALVTQLGQAGFEVEHAPNGAVAEFLLQAGMYGDRTLNLDAVPAVGLVVETQCRYFAPISYPDEITCGLRVARLGNSSIRYELGVFRNAEDQASAEAHFIHVYVDRADQSRTVPVPLKLREAAARVLAG